MNNNTISFEIKEHIGVLSTRKNMTEDWSRELNIVSWNGGKDKFDIREWDSKHERMTRGITLTEDEARKLMEELTDYFFKLESANI